MVSCLRRVTICVLVMFCMTGCGVFTSGTWEDDDGNWERAFGSAKPEDVVLLHSKYWRSSHWSYEFEYFFEIECNADFQDQIITDNNLVKLEKYVELAMNNFFDEPPAWFLPKGADGYDVWVFEEELDSNFRLFIDKETCNLFLTDHII